MFGAVYSAPDFATVPMPQRRMKATALASILFTLCAAYAVGAAEPASRAQLLVRAMRSDELAVSGAKRAFISGAVPNYAQASPGCVKRVDYKDFTGKFAQVV